MRYIIILYFVAYINFFSCSEDTESIRQVVFKISIAGTDEFGIAPVVTISHNGTNRDEYCCFLAEGPTQNLEQRINEYVSKNEGNISRMSQKKKVIKLQGLTPGKIYTYIVFGLTSNNVRYGQPVSEEFSVLGTTFMATINPNWKVDYRGKQLYEGNYYSLTSVKVDKSSKESFFVYEYEPSFVSTFNSVEDFLYYAVDDYHNRLRTHDSNAFWKEDNQLHTESVNHFFHLGDGQYRDKNKEYVSYAIGINSDGGPTGHYALSDTFELGEYPFLDSYSYLVGRVVGKWKAESDDGKTTLNARFNNKIANETIEASWEEFSIIKYYTIHFSPNDASLTIFDEQVDANSLKIDGTTVFGNTFVKSWYLNDQGDTLLSSASKLAHGTIQQDGTYRFLPVAEEENSGLIFVFYANDGRVVLNQNTSIPLPFTMVKQN